MKIVAVTSCPTGIAHTYMAAESLEQAALAQGHEISVETQGAAGATPLQESVIAQADVAIFAADVEVRDKERFVNLPILEVDVKKAINAGPDVIVEALRKVGTKGVSPSGPVLTNRGNQVSSSDGPGTKLRKWLMTGVSYMIPFVAAGGILIALSFVIGGPQVAMEVNGGTFHGVHYAGVTGLSHLYAQTGLAGLLFQLGSTAFSMLVPILSGYIAFAMVDRPGIVPGVVGGLVASAIGAGFLGGLIAGLLAGFVVMAIKKFEVPRAFSGIMTVVVIPLVSTAIVGILMLVAIGQPIATITSGLGHWLNGLTGANAIILGGLLGLMMAFDMGGPVNKVAYTFGVASLATGNETIMAAVMAAGMVPPLALALATIVRRNLFTEAERHAGQAAWLLGASFITEGAIPFAAGDPVRVIPSIMIGSGVTGALSMMFGASSPAPHGGIWVVGLLGKPELWVLAIVIGTVVGAGCVIIAKSLGKNPATSNKELVSVIG